MTLSFERILIGGIAALLGLLVTFGLPVSPRRVNQTLPIIMMAALFFGAAYAFLEWPVWAIAGFVAVAVGIIYRDIVRFVKHIYWDVTKYSRRDFWYRRIGEAVLGSNSRRRSRR